MKQGWVIYRTPKTSLETHIGYKYHASVRDKVEKCLDISVLFEHPANIVTVGFVLYGLQNRRSASNVKTVHPARETWVWFPQRRNLP